MIFEIEVKYEGCTIKEVEGKPSGFRLWFTGANCEFWVKNSAFVFSVKHGKIVKSGMNARLRDMITICVLSKCDELHIPLAEIKNVREKRIKKPVPAINLVKEERDDGTIENVEIEQLGMFE